MRWRPITMSRARFAVVVASALFCLWCALLTPRTAAAQVEDDDVQVSVLTFGPGGHPFTKFGHTALLVERRAHAPALVYNWGTFSFDSVWLFPRFLRGTYRYWLAAQSLSATLRAYAHEHRWAVMQRLRLTSVEKRALLASLQVDMREENRYYDYDYYRDNCVTRVRDEIDRATHGSLSSIAHVPAELTWRQHTSRATSQAPLLHFLLNATLTSPTDRPIEAWDEMFLPAKFHEWLRRATVRDGNAVVPLVEYETVLLEDQAWGAPPSPPSWVPTAITRMPNRPGGSSGNLLGCLVSGTSIGTLLALLGYWASRASRWGTALLALCTSLVGLSAGLLGALFVFLWVATRHTFAHHNENLLQLSPLGLLVPLLAGLAATGRPYAARLTWSLMTVCLGASILGWLLKTTPVFAQKNAEVVALCLPTWLGAAAGWWLAASRHERKKEDA